jgi:hypothetical protein
MAEESSDAEVERLKQEEAKQKAIEEAARQREVVTIGSSVGLKDLTAELHEFNCLLNKMAKPSSAASGSASNVLNSEILKAKHSCALQTIKAYASKSEDASKMLPAY